MADRAVAIATPNSATRTRLIDINAAAVVTTPIGAAVGRAGAATRAVRADAPGAAADAVGADHGARRDARVHVHEASKRSARRARSARTRRDTAARRAAADLDTDPTTIAAIHLGHAALPADSSGPRADSVRTTFVARTAALRAESPGVCVAELPRATVAIAAAARADGRWRNERVDHVGRDRRVDDVRLGPSNRRAARERARGQRPPTTHHRANPRRRAQNVHSHCAYPPVSDGDTPQARALRRVGDD